MEHKQLITQYCRQFNLSGVSKVIDELITEAQGAALGYLDYTVTFLGTEASYREQKDLKKRLRLAQLPRYCNLDTYDHSVSNGLTKTHLHQLQELHWLDQIYNIIFMGPSGTGKTFLSAGLCHQAIKKGYKAYFRTMDDLIAMLKMRGNHDGR